MIRQRDDAVSTFIKTTITPVMANKFVMHSYWDEVGRQVEALIGPQAALKLKHIIFGNAVLHALYKKSEQSRVDLIIMLQRSGRI